MSIIIKLLVDVTYFICNLSLLNIISLSCLLFLVAGFFVWCFTNGKKGKNPFSRDCIRPRSALVIEKEKRKKVLKQKFLPTNVPLELDAIVIGSGIGGLSCAALLAKACKKVLVLEQHDQAGGCCHTFIKKGFEFDVGIHYIGEVGGNTLMKTYIDQITEGQVHWAPVNDVIDVVEFNSINGKRSTHRVLKGEAWKNELMKTFPKEHDAINKYFDAMKKARQIYSQSFILKVLPIWFVMFIIKTRLFHLISHFPNFCSKSLGTFLNEITTDDELKAVLSYSFGDYGTQPRESPMIMQLMLMQHYRYGGYYPVGGASEIAFSIIPIIERAGGKVLTKAKVIEIVVEDKKVTGVKVDTKSGPVIIHAPVIISAVGLINTCSMLSESLTCRSNLTNILGKVRSGHGAISIFVGLDGSNEELNLQATNTWLFSNIDLDKSLDEYLALSKDHVAQNEVPLLFISFPSTKDPSWDERYPGKSNCTIITLANWEWFVKWEKERKKKRGKQYDELKMRIAEKCWEQTLSYYPQLRNRRVYFEVGTPVTNKYYLGSAKGEIYGLDHSLSRFNPEVIAQLRPCTEIPGLYLTGQDILTAGFAGALYSGLLTASTVLNRNLVNDLITLKKEITKISEKKKN